MPDCTLVSLRGEYLSRWLNAALHEATTDALNAAEQAVASREIYEDVGGGIPWWFIAALHYREADCLFSTHLHNGDPLTRRTIHVPAGRPLSGSPPFTWQESARDALQMSGLWGLTDWSVATALWQAERYNGFGYRTRGAVSPYLWSGTSQYKSGR